LGNTNILARVDSLEQDRLKDPALSPDEQIALRVQKFNGSCRVPLKLQLRML